MGIARKVGRGGGAGKVKVKGMRRTEAEDDGTSLGSHGTRLRWSIQRIIHVIVQDQRIWEHPGNTGRESKLNHTGDKGGGHPREHTRNRTATEDCRESHQSRG